MSSKWLAIDNPTGEIIQHFPPQLVVGKLTTREEPYYIYEDNDIIRMEIVQVRGEYCYSCPTGLFNLACPTKKRKTSLHYMSESYKNWKAK